MNTSMIPGRTWLALGIAVLAGAGCGASIDPAMKRQVDRRVANITQQDETYDAPTATSTPEIQVGTWATYKLIDDEGQPSFLTYKVLRRDGDRYWLETVTEGYYGRNVQLMRVSFGSRETPEDIEVDRLLHKSGDDAVEEYPADFLGMMGSLYKPMLARLSISWKDLPQEDVTVPAGTFEKAYKKRVDSSFAGFSDTSDVWYHDAAKVGGTVRSQSISGGSSMELVDMGTDPQPVIPIPE